MSKDGRPGRGSVWFQLECADEPEAFLVVREPETGALQTFPMRRRPDGCWEQVVALHAGHYRARCYAGSAGRVIYYGPAHVGGSDVCVTGRAGLDTAIHVKTPPPRDIGADGPPRYVGAPTGPASDSVWRPCPPSAVFWRAAFHPASSPVAPAVKLTEN